LTGRERKERRAYLGWDLVYDLQLVGKGSEMLLLPQAPKSRVPARHRANTL
jgi:hypothetical protein